MAIITTFNDLEVSTFYPIGTIIKYHGIGIGGGNTGNITTRTDKISTANGDSIDFGQGDWYVCNGKSATPNIMDGRMVRGSATSGVYGGSNNAVVVSHTHSGSTSAGSHSHSLTSSTGSHVHNMDIAYAGVSVLRKYAGDSTWFWMGTLQDTLGYRYTDAGGSHTHAISGAGAHDHGGNTTTNGSSGSGANVPYVTALIFVIKKA